MRIAYLIFAVLSVLGLLGFGLATQRLWVAHSNVVIETRNAELAQARSYWYEGTVALSFERSVTQVALALDTPIPDAFRALIEDQRRKSDGLFGRSLAQLDATGPFENRDRFLATVQTQRAAIATLRREADRLLAQPAAARDPNRSYQMPYDLKSEIERLFASTSLLVLANGIFPTTESAMAQVQALAWETREYAGRARTFYAIAALTGEPIPERFSGEARVDTLRGIAGWERIQIVRQSVQMPDAVHQALAKAEAAFAQQYLEALSKMDDAMAAMRAGEDVAMPYSFEDFFALSNEGLDAVASIAPLMGELIQDFWNVQIRAARTARNVSALIAVLTVLLSVSSVHIMRRRLILPLGEATRVLHDMSEGKLDRKFRQTRRHLDEMRVMWDAMESLTSCLQEARKNAEQERQADARAREAEERAKQGIVGELMTGLERMAQGNLTYEIVGEFGDAYSDLITNFNHTGTNLRDAIGNVVLTANDIAEHAAGLSSAIDDLSHRSENQMRIVSETTQSLRTLIDMLEETARNTQSSLRTVTEAADKSEAGRHIVETAIKAMDDIHASSANIRGFGDVIDGIAFQTNLLSLNAGVEAARAGDTGKGFGVVAQEVRSLARQASEAAQHVKDQVQTSAHSVSSGVDEVKKTGRALEEISDMVAEVHKLIQHIDDASHQQSQTISQLGETMEGVDEISRQNAQMAIQATETSATLQHSANALRNSVSRFSIGGAASQAAPDRWSA
ncbi:MAG: methyl-accepting chemotaxis protein [Pseudomonadota bacterium]